jgi:hypothetical protein
VIKRYGRVDIVAIERPIKGLTTKFLVIAKTSDSFFEKKWGERVRVYTLFMRKDLSDLPQTGWFVFNFPERINSRKIKILSSKDQDFEKKEKTWRLRFYIFIESLDTMVDLSAESDTDQTFIYSISSAGDGTTSKKPISALEFYDKTKPHGCKFPDITETKPFKLVVKKAILRPDGLVLVFLDVEQEKMRYNYAITLNFSNEK